MSEWTTKRFEPKAAAKTQCAANVRAFRTGEQCLFPAWKDGFCKRHHPETQRATLLKKLHRYQRLVTETLLEIAEAEKQKT